jgi:hypothetical protein
VETIPIVKIGSELSLNERGRTDKLVGELGV